MKYYFAPLEGITGYIYRQAHHRFYPGLDRYYTPFIVPKEKKYLNTKERNDLLAVNNEGMQVIPQIMTNQAGEFLRIAQVLAQDYGYKEVNLNLGCPSRTVVSKKRGSGFLSEPCRLEAFLTEVCNGLEKSGIKLSVKTRIGIENPEEFADLLQIFLTHPLSELIVHPRLQKDFYQNSPDRQAFFMAYRAFQSAEWELCYNGDVSRVSDAEKISSEFPGISAVMIGRGLLKNPMLIDEIKAGEQKAEMVQRFADEESETAERKKRYQFYRVLQEDYASVLSGEKDVLFKMKELWSYMCQDFTEPQKYWKKMKKAQKLSDFEAAALSLCREQKLLSHINA